MGVSGGHEGVGVVLTQSGRANADLAGTVERGNTVVGAATEAFQWRISFAQVLITGS